ncbi:hypothetical protein [Hufsiella ginkgonis]|uniref:RHS repeat-associated core domain-containing protein n=1 Tax=Hufsiella ginkgonis TaxID=2695274 RepID=A0A7K1XX89_9SPHI|nr:hypothetical protein [Hufsiella ginkgonis]MXV15625.1 hypothetical protein [Hufsiella ginkgonis]
MKQVLTYDPVTTRTLSRIYRYYDHEDPALSSGRLMHGKVSYYSNLEVRQVSHNSSMILNYYAASSGGNISLFSQTGNHVVYQDVTESEDTAYTNGATWHHFQVAADSVAATIRGGGVPHAPYYQDGTPQALEVRTVQYKSGGPGELVKLQETRQHYVNTVMGTPVTAYAARKNWEDPVFTGLHPYDLSMYTLSTNWVYSDSTISVNYDAGTSRPVQTVTLTEYANAAHLQPTKTTTTGSDGLVRYSTFLYPAEKVAAGATIPYQAMIDQNQVTALAEKKDFVNGAFQEKTINTYSNALSANTTPYLLYKIQTQHKNESAEDRIEYSAYDNLGNPVTVSMASGPKISYRWGYNQQYPVAEIKNALSTECYLQDFEAGGGSASNASHTGTSRSSGSAYTVSFTLPNARGYVISYWYMDADERWHYSGELPYTGSSYALSGHSYYDDIRVYPADAQLSTFTYLPQVGTWSSIDSRGVTTYYQYDVFRRLRAIKDTGGNTVKTFTYHYGN